MCRASVSHSKHIHIVSHVMSESVYQSRSRVTVVDVDVTLVASVVVLKKGYHGGGPTAVQA